MTRRIVPVGKVRISDTVVLGSRKKDQKVVTDVSVRPGLGEHEDGSAVVQIPTTFYTLTFADGSAVDPMTESYWMEVVV